jgi:hypothetical protein
VRTLAWPRHRLRGLPRRVPANIVRLVLRQAATIIGIGLAIGLTVTFMAAESLSKLLYGICARDAISFTVLCC